MKFFVLVNINLERMVTSKQKLIVYALGVLVYSVYVCLYAVRLISMKYNFLYGSLMKKNSKK